MGGGGGSKGCFEFMNWIIGAFSLQVKILEKKIVGLVQLLLIMLIGFLNLSHNRHLSCCGNLRRLSK